MKTLVRNDSPVSIQPSAKPSKTFKDKLAYSLKRYWQLYLMLLLPVVYIIVFQYYPMIGLQIAFKKFSPKLGIWGSHWVGFKYFIKFFTSYQFKEVLINTFTISFYAVIAQLPIPIMLALSLNAVRNRFYKKTAQLLSYMPHFISTVVIVSMLMQIFNPRIGLLANLLGLFGVKISDAFGSPGVFSHLYVWSNVWQSAGWASIIYLAALAGIDQQLYEAARIDGAKRWKQTLHITIPCLVPTIIILFILRLGNMLNLGFEKIILLYNPATYETADVISSYVYRKGILEFSWSFSAAVGLFNSVINFGLVVGANWISRKTSETSLW
jgi:putative aldouronate transport system permease protein